MATVDILYTGLLVLCGSCLGACEYKKIMNLKPIPVYLFTAIVSMILVTLLGAVQGQFIVDPYSPDGLAVFFFLLSADAATSVIFS